ncbi:MAG: toll/interleukin-1 receptor domain-containing protein [Planctomycetaceae bacterium]|nr:toll/interleukin-1 receptor domain-containing protein [Planctomycetaceae bacterium]
MAHNAEEWRRLRSEFIEAAAKYEDEGYRTFIQRTAHGEEWYSRTGRYDCVAEIKWPYRPWRKCWILAPSSGTDQEPFSTMKTLFTKAWLWLPRVVAGRIVDAAEWQLSPRVDVGLLWAKSHYEFWCWLLWFDWLWRCGEVKMEEPEFPPAGMDLRPFSSSVDLIGRWGLDGSDGTFPDWLSLPTASDPEPQPPAVEPLDAAGGGGKTPMTFDVFLSYNSDDRPIVDELANKLQNEGLTVWLDTKKLVRGEHWQNGIGEGIDRSLSVAVCIGPAGIGRWQKEEMQHALNRKAADKTFRVIPLLLPGASAKPELPFPLGNRHWVDFRNGFDPDELKRLVGDIRGAYPIPDDYERDKWIYEQRLAGATNPEIIEALEGNKNCWGPLTSEDSIRDAIKRYCLFHRLKVPQGRRGRPAKTGKPRKPPSKNPH